MIESPNPKRTQAERTRTRKEQVIREATLLFAQYGYRGARLADIAKAANLTEPGLLHHFPTKEHLLMDVLAERDRADQQRFQPTSPGQEDQSLSSLQALVEHNETVPGLVQLFTVLVAESIDPDHPSHNFFVERYRNIRTNLSLNLKIAQGHGLIRSDIHPDDLAVMIFALMDGLQLQWLMEPNQIHMSTVFQIFLQILVADDQHSDNK